MDSIINGGERPYHIVMQAYGNEGVLQECIFALLSFSKFHTPEECARVHFHIYTDQPEWFQQYADCPLQLSFRTISKQDLKQWRGAIDFVHRVKIEVLRDFVKHHTGAVLYLDCDVHFLKPVLPLLQRIAAGELFMHVAESRLSDRENRMMKKLHDFFKKKQQVYNVDLDSMMWNAGVLGFTTDQALLLDEVLSFTDKAYAQYPKHVIEQFAFSYYFQQAGKIHSTTATVFHYWILAEAKSVLHSFFNHFKGQSWVSLLRYSELIQHHVIVQQKTSFFINRSLHGKIKKERWHPVIPDWSMLAEQM